MIRYRPNPGATPGLRVALRTAVLSAAAMLGGCASGGLSGDSTLAMYVDPARYDLYNCAQLRTVKRDQQMRIGELEALMSKAQTGTGGSVVAAITYRGDYDKARANYNLADKVWQRNKCDSERLPPDKIVVPAQPQQRDPLLPPAPYDEPAPIDQVYRR